MIHRITLDFPKIKTIYLELDDVIAPKTIKAFLDCLPLTVGINLWGEELYTDEIPVAVSTENAKSLVDLMDVAYWPPGKAICLFFGPTPIGKKGEIKPYSSVNVIGKIKDEDKRFLKDIRDGMMVTFRVSK
ncbi:MAG: cyclophilin-like fold protein [Nitrosopumilaceae archaeon]